MAPLRLPLVSLLLTLGCVTAPTPVTQHPEPVAHATREPRECASLARELAGAPAEGEASRLFRIGEAFARCGEAAEAQRWIAASLEGEARCEAWVALGVVASDAGDRATAEDAFRAGGCPAAALNLSVLLRRQGRAREAVDAARQALMRASGALRVRALDALALGWLALAEEDITAIERAELACLQATAADRLHAPAHNTCGLVWLAQGDVVQALQAFEAAYAIDPGFYEAWMNHAQVALSFRDHAEAERLFGRALQARPRAYDALLGRGVARRGLGDVEGARRDYELARAVDPERPEAWFNLGVLHQEHPRGEGDLEAARDLFAEFLEKAGEEPRLAETVAEVRSRLLSLDAPRRGMPRE